MNLKYINIYIIYYIIFLSIVVSQEITNNCGSRRTCGECIQDIQCTWFIQTEDNKDHCRSVKYSKNDKNTVSPKTFIHPFKIKKVKAKGDLTNHLSINMVNLTVRPGDSYNFNFKYTHKVEYPVDIYFLMDMSKSMQHYRKTISDFASVLFEEMFKLSKDVKVGFGSFVDKTILPYVNATADKIENPCKVCKTCEVCELPYSFKNHLPLSDDAFEFARKVNNTLVSGNIDGPEGSLEALLQAIVCTEEIGWREQARHLIILSTDDTFHIAGDGKLAGIVEPNDGECHLKDNIYTHGLLQDYPSIGQIRERAANKSKNILYIVTPPQEELYRKLQNSIRNSYLGILESNSKNIIDLLTQFYANITGSVRFEHNFPTNNFDVKLTSKDCPDYKNNICSNILNDEIYEFTAKINFNTCPDDGKYTQNYVIKPMGLNEEIKIQVEMICDCPCEHLGHQDYEESSKKCSEQGDLQCGVCKCNTGRIGRQCQCAENSADLAIDDSSNCKVLELDEECSGVGECKCGQCHCNPPFSGQYCQCNNQICVTNKVTNEICSKHGLCNCGKCNCYTNWSGDKCDCSELKDTCKTPESTEICSGKGECICGQCVCTDKEKHGGQFCEECKTCPKTCDYFEDCVKCYYKENTEETCSSKCDQFVINDTLDGTNNTDKLCTYINEENCMITFSYIYDQINGAAEIGTQKDCTPTQAGIYSLVYIITSILLLGILTMLIWKALTYFSDRREYEKFVNETKKAEWNTEVNPLFKTPVSEFQNPLFKKSE